MDEAKDILEFRIGRMRRSDFEHRAECFGVIAVLHHGQVWIQVI